MFEFISRLSCSPLNIRVSGLSALYAAALTFDATIFLLTFARAIYMRITKSTIPLAQLIIRDGTLYFLCEHSLTSPLLGNLFLTELFS